MDTKELNIIKKDAEEHAAYYVPVIFPMLWDSANKKYGFYKADGSGIFWFTGITLDGLTYLLYRLGKFVDRDKAKESSDRTVFVDYINSCRKNQEYAYPKQENKTLYLAMEPRQTGDVLWGVLTHYNPVSNASVLERVTKMIGSYVTKVQYNLPKYIKIVCHSRYIVDKKLSFGLAIINGETGHHTLGYHLYVATQDYMFTFPMQDRRRHLSRVSDIDDSLVAVLQAVQAVEIDQILLNTKADVFIDKLPQNLRTKLQLNLKRYESADSLISYLTDLRLERGKKTAADKALDGIFKQAFELLS